MLGSGFHDLPLFATVILASRKPVSISMNPWSLLIGQQRLVGWGNLSASGRSYLPGVNRDRALQLDVFATLFSTLARKIQAYFP